MKRIFLMNFSTAVLIDVARNLKKQGIEIVYWQGYRDDFDTFVKTKTEFEITVFRHMFDANKNIPPEGIDASAFEPVSRELAAKMRPYEIPALSMIARADYINPPFVKRRHVYYEYVKFWRGMIHALKPDAVIFVSVPHSASSFVLYGLAKVFGVKTVMLGRSSIDSRILVFSDYILHSTALRAEYQRIKDAKYTVDDLSADILEHYLKQKNIQSPEKSGNEPCAHLATRHNQMPFKTPSVVSIVKHIRDFTFFTTVRSYLRMLFSTRKMHYYDRDFTGLQMTFMTRRWGRKSKALRKEYRDLQVQPNYGSKYIYVPLAFQPEQTTCPSGDIFDDQLLMIDMLAAALPDDWVMYVKEHLPQWFPHRTETHLYRYEGYYRAIAIKKNVRLVPAETHPYELIKNAQAVATVTGTTGWEALCRSVPALVFGSVWYMYCDGVFRIDNLGDCQDAIKAITDRKSVV